MIPPADKQMLTHCVLKVELGKPVFLLPMEGQPVARLAYRDAGRGELENAKADL
jgi:hypothetical protein